MRHGLYETERSKRVREAKERALGQRVCHFCHEPFESASKMTRWCASCREEKAKAYEEEKAVLNSYRRMLRARKNVEEIIERMAVQQEAGMTLCTRCGIAFTNPHEHKLCPQCREYMRNYKKLKRGQR